MSLARVAANYLCALGLKNTPAPTGWNTVLFNK
jgi:hypothetical protein